MSRPAVRDRPGRGAAVATLLALASGCALPAGGRTGRPLEREAVATIVPGTTTKAQLFERLGAPLAIVGRGEYAEVAAAAVTRPVPPRPAFVTQRGGTWPLQGDAALAIFADRHPLGGEHRVYYYACTDDHAWTVFWVVFASETYETRTDELWVLVDEASERVVDLAFRPGG